MPVPISSGYERFRGTVKTNLDQDTPGQAVLETDMEITNSNIYTYSKGPLALGSGHQVFGQFVDSCCVVNNLSCPYPPRFLAVMEGKQLSAIAAYGSK